MIFTKVILGLGFLGLLSLPSLSLATNLPPGFEDIPVAEGFDSPTGFSYAPDGRIFVGEKFGRVRMVLPNGKLVKKPLLDISDKVNSAGDRGFVGIETDVNFAKNRYLYLLYTYENSPEDPEGSKNARLTRVVVNPDNTLKNPKNPEKVILGKVVGDAKRNCPELGNFTDCFDTRAPWHSVGTVRSAPDGSLWVGNGDGTHIGQNRLYAGQVLPTDRYNGKLLHIDRNGRGLPNHPFCKKQKNLNAVCTKVYARGFRNPFRFDLTSKGIPIVGDVGYFWNEEINIVRPGRNYGWPCLEGETWGPMGSIPECHQPRYQPFVKPTHYYPWAGGGSIVGGPEYSARKWPSEYRGGLFYGDYVKSFIKYLKLENGAYKDYHFADNLDGIIVDLQASPDGHLAYMDIGYGPGSNGLRKIVYTPDNKTPRISLKDPIIPTQLPATIQFDASETLDPDGDNLSFSWNFGDGSTGSGPQTSHTYTKQGVYLVTLRVSDNKGKFAYKRIYVAPGNSAPTLKIIRPLEGDKYVAGSPVKLEARAFDREDGRLVGDDIIWTLKMQHNDHLHGESQRAGRLAGFPPNSDHELDVSYVVTATAMDSAGVSVEKTIKIYPKAIKLTLSSDFPITLNFNYKEFATPSTLTTAAGFATQISAPKFVTHEGKNYEFLGWSTGGEREQVYSAPKSSGELRALYLTPLPKIRVPLGEYKPESLAYERGKTLIPLHCVAKRCGHNLKLESLKGKKLGATRLKLSQGDSDLILKLDRRTLRAASKTPRLPVRLILTNRTGSRSTLKLILNLKKAFPKVSTVQN